MTPSGETLFEFTHTAFREHLAASHLARMSAADMAAIMRAHFSHASWGAAFVTALELGHSWQEKPFPRDVGAAVGGTDEGLARTAQSWIKQVLGL